MRSALLGELHQKLAVPELRYCKRIAKVTSMTGRQVSPNWAFCDMTSTFAGSGH